MSTDEPIDVLSLGEAVLDLMAVERGPLRRARTFEVHSGGAPYNVAVGAARLGARAAFAGAVGGDEFGALLRDALVEQGIDCAGLRHDPEGRTWMCFIAVSPAGERSFFYPVAGGDVPVVGPEDLSADQIRRARVVQFGSGTLASERGRAAVERLIALARSAGAVVTFDPNPRLHHWPDEATLRTCLDALIPRCDVVKCSIEEAALVVGSPDPSAMTAEAAAAALVNRGVPLAVVTAGPDGAVWARAGDRGAVPAPRVPVVDTTGAGDAFMAALLTRLAAESAAGATPATIPADRLRDHLTFACEIGAAAVTRLGAVAGVPRLRPHPSPSTP